MSILTMHHGLMAGIKQGDPPGYVTIGGRLYRTVTIGTQTWLAENLDYKWEGLTIGANDTSDTIQYAWYYNNDQATYGLDGTKPCGMLYDWAAANYLETNKSTLLPEGWHVPTLTEWQTMLASVGGADTAAPKLRKTVVDWAPGFTGTDDYGFGVVPAGYRSLIFDEIGTGARFSVANQKSTSDQYSIGVGATSTSIGTGNLYYARKFNAFSIRLVKDAT